MNTDLSKILVQDYDNLLEAGGELADVEFQVGPEQEIFKVHSLVLWTRSQYFRSEIWAVREDTFGGSISLSLPNITPRMFKILLKYIYTGVLEPASHKRLKDAVHLMLGAKDLGLTNLIDYIQSRLTSRKEQLRNNFFFINRTSKGKLPQLDNLCDELLVQDPLAIINSTEFLTVDKDELFYFYENLPTNLPTTFPEIALWDKLIEWGKKYLKQSKDGDLNGDELEELKQLVEPFIEYIDFKNIKRDDFFTKVKPYKSVLNQEKYIELLESHTELTPQPPQPQPPPPQPQQSQPQPSQPQQSQPRSYQRSQPPPPTRKSKAKNRPPPAQNQKKTRGAQQTTTPFHQNSQAYQQQQWSFPQQPIPQTSSPALNFHPQNFQSPYLQYSPQSFRNEDNDDDSVSSSSTSSEMISSQPQESIPAPTSGPSAIIEPNHFRLLKTWINEIHARPQNTRYDFNLLVRGTVSGFTAKNFHRRCDNKGPTITILRVQDTNEILGGYNPLFWDTPKNNETVLLRTGESFIFSLDFEKLRNSVFSKVKRVHADKAILLSADSGPLFGSTPNVNGDLKVSGSNFTNCGCKLLMYEKPIRISSSKFGLNEYEVFQVVEVDND